MVWHSTIFSKLYQELNDPEKDLRGLDKGPHKKYFKKIPAKCWKRRHAGRNRDSRRMRQLNVAGPQPKTGHAQPSGASADNALGIREYGCAGRHRARLRDKTLAVSCKIGESAAARLFLGFDAPALEKLSVSAAGRERKFPRRDFCKNNNIYATLYLHMMNCDCFSSLDIRSGGHIY
jgi:hypothetical protein